ncbi:hypothetical protein EHQ58_14810 [Leptospira ognonensis]|uniref:Uncharacterized protein n=1 Tax=Leptospira ognonensis TaxID=2484945 RepID=A0A4R9JXI8_9LEPT|nr:hypothetical protein [Leptospira ognonensis]TGL57192.1 hypothetical protein EHQ58_14810 [Leptospira ognonensis]
MKLKELLDERTKPILDEINRIGFNIRLIESKEDDSTWTSIKSKSAKKTYDIGYSICKDPKSSFVHELLHVYIQTKGYKIPITAITMNDVSQEDLLNYKGYLDNEIQHWKFYKKYLELGFDSKYFFNDEDQKDFSQNLTKTLKLIPTIPIKTEQILDIVLNFITAIIPIGNLSITERENYENEFYTLRSGIYKKKLIEIKEVLNRWSESDVYDSKEIFTNIFRIIEIDKTWFSYYEIKEGITADVFPSKGFFVNMTFTFEDLVSHFNK